MTVKFIFTWACILVLAGLVFGLWPYFGSRARSNCQAINAGRAEGNRRAAANRAMIDELAVLAHNTKILELKRNFKNLPPREC